MPHSLDIQKETFYNCPCSDCSDNCPRFSWDGDTHKYKLHMHTLVADGYRWCCTEMLFFNWPPRVMAAVRRLQFFFVFLLWQDFSNHAICLTKRAIDLSGNIQAPNSISHTISTNPALINYHQQQGPMTPDVTVRKACKLHSITARNIRNSSSIKCQLIK